MFGFLGEFIGIAGGTIGGIFRAFGILSFLGGLLFGGWLVKIPTTVRNAAVLLIAALLVSGCIAPMRMPQDNTLMKGSTSTGSLGRKPVTGKREPAYLIAVDGTECTVSKKKFKKVKVGDAVFCLWSSPTQGF